MNNIISAEVNIDHEMFVNVKERLLKELPNEVNKDSPLYSTPNSLRKRNILYNGLDCILYYLETKLFE